MGFTRKNIIGAVVILLVVLWQGMFFSVLIPCGRKGECRHATGRYFK